MLMVKSNSIVYSRSKQLTSRSYYETDYKIIPPCLSKEVRIEKDRGFHEGKSNGKNFDEWFRVKHPIHKYNKGCNSTGLLKTINPNYFNGDFPFTNGHRIKLTFEFSPDREKLVVTIN